MVPESRWWPAGTTLSHRPYRLSSAAFALQYHLYRLYHPLSIFREALESAEAPL